MNLTIDINPNQLSDDDAELVARYLGDLLSEADAVAFEDRLIDDQPFHDLAWPLVEAWHSPVITDAEREMVATMESEKQRKARKAEWNRGREGRKYRRYVTFAMAATILMSVFQQTRPDQNPNPAPTLGGDVPRQVPPTGGGVAPTVVAVAPRRARPDAVVEPVPAMAVETETERRSTAAAEQPLPAVAATPVGAVTVVVAGPEVVSVAELVVDNTKDSTIATPRDILAPRTPSVVAGDTDKGAHWPRIFTIPWEVLKKIPHPHLGSVPKGPSGARGGGKG
jgi:hypothetical protein